MYFYYSVGDTNGLFWFLLKTFVSSSSFFSFPTMIFPVWKLHCFFSVVVKYTATRMITTVCVCVEITLWIHLFYGGLKQIQKRELLILSTATEKWAPLNSRAHDGAKATVVSSYIVAVTATFWLSLILRGLGSGELTKILCFSLSKLQNVWGRA